MSCDSGRIHGHHFEAVIMNMTDLLKAFKPDPQHAYHADWDALCADELSHFSWNYDYKKFSDAVKEYYVYSWICTDTRVGLSIITLHDIVVAVARQTARKSDKRVAYLTEVHYNQLRDFMRSCVNEEAVTYETLDFEEEISLTPEEGVEIRHLKV